ALGTQSFTDALVTITGSGDTANVSHAGGLFTNDSLTATVTVAGIGPGGSDLTATLTDSIGAFDPTGKAIKPAQACVEVQPVGGFVVDLDTSNSFFAGYDLKTSISPPVSGAFSANRAATDHGLGTDKGTLTFTGFGSTSTFGATLAVPE